MTPQHEWISVFEASRRLNRSVSTIRRMIEAGELIGEREAIGGSRERYRVRMPQEPQITPQLAPPPDPTPVPPDASVASESTHQGAQGAAEIIRAAIGPYVTINQRLGEAYAGAMAENQDLSERVGRAEAERDSLRAAHADCSNLSHAEASRFVQEATEQRFRADDLAARLAAAEARAAEAERKIAGRRWWRRILG